jgi:hypothetical protein
LSPLEAKTIVALVSKLNPQDLSRSGTQPENQNLKFAGIDLYVKPAPAANLGKGKITGSNMHFGFKRIDANGLFFSSLVQILNHSMISFNRFLLIISISRWHEKVFVFNIS